MAKKKLKNNESNLSLPAQEFEKLLPSLKDLGLIETAYVAGSLNSRLKAGKERHDACLVKNEFKKDRLERLVKLWLERLSKQCSIATESTKAFTPLLLSLILPPIVKNGFEGKLKILQALNVVPIHVTKSKKEKEVLDTTTLGVSMNLTGLDWTFPTLNLEKNFES